MLFCPFILYLVIAVSGVKHKTSKVLTSRQYVNSTEMAQKKKKTWIQHENRRQMRGPISGLWNWNLPFPDRMRKDHVTRAGLGDVASQSPTTRFSRFTRDDKHCGPTPRALREARHVIDNPSLARAAFITTINEEYAFARCLHTMAKLWREVAVKLCLSLTSTFLTL